jgi:hypothetical protein
MITYKNRYGGEYTFTLQEDGNILWEGPFEYSRIGYPNDYSVAYKKWHNDFPKTEMLSLGDFSQVVHQYDEEKQQYKYKEYLDLVTVEKDKIYMVDPSGGPYISRKVNMKFFSTEFEGKIVKDIKKVKLGYLLICNSI